MTKVKLVTTLALVVVMTMVMTGVVAATAIDVVPQEPQLIPDEYVKTTVSITGIFYPDNVHTLVVAGPFGAPISDLTFYVYNSQTNTESEMAGRLDYIYTPGSPSCDLEVYIKTKSGTEGNEYMLWYDDVDTGSWDSVRATVLGTAIPEFATIAIPVASIFGLLLFFKHSKRKKE